MEITEGPMTLAVGPERWAIGTVVGVTLARETGSTVDSGEHGIWLGAVQARDLGFYILGASGLIRPEVLKFVRLMEEKLRLHDDDKPGWKDARPGALLVDLSNHLVKMHDRLGRGTIQTGRDIADCLNYLMMVADVCGLLPTGDTPPPPDHRALLAEARHALTTYQGLTASDMAGVEPPYGDEVIEIDDKALLARIDAALGPPAYPALRVADLDKTMTAVLHKRARGDYRKKETPAS